MTKDQALWLLKNEPYKLGHWCGFRDLTLLHNEWLKSFLFAKEDQTLLGHRGSYKTTTLALFLAVHTVIKPDEVVLFFRKTDNDVVEVISLTKKLLKSPAFTALILAIYGKELVFITDSATEIDTNLTSEIKGAKQVTGLGIGTSITGKHGDVIVTDDIVNINDRASKAEREKTIRAYMELQNIKNRGGRFINTGTPWHKDDAISKMPNVKRYDCYSTGLISPEEIRSIRSKMTDSLFAANYELRHISESDVIFKDPRFCEDWTQIYDGIAHIDAAYGGSDYTAYTVMKSVDGRLIAYGRLWHKHVDDCIEEIAETHARLRAGSIYVETNGDKGYLAKELKAKGFSVKKYAESMNKYLKICTHLRASWQSIEWIEDTDPEYLAQVLDYNENADNDDAPDSAACVVRAINKRPRMNRVAGGF